MMVGSISPTKIPKKIDSTKFLIFPFLKFNFRTLNPLASNKDICHSCGVILKRITSLVLTKKVRMEEGCSSKTRRSPNIYKLKKILSA